MPHIHTSSREFARIYDGIFPSCVTAGFTLPALAGNVQADMPELLAAMGTRAGIACMDQVHGADVRIVDGPGRYACDGIFTRSRSLAAVVRTADCLPLVLYSGKEGIAGVVHMGWRSADGGILENTGFDLASFTCVAGVGLRKCCYRVGEDFLARGRMRPFVRHERDGHYFDPIAFARHALVGKGLAEESFFDAGICSYCSRGGFHSHRKTGTKDRTLSFIAMV